jgi:protein O-mannosyl-transferase
MAKKNKKNIHIKKDNTDEPHVNESPIEKISQEEQSLGPFSFAYQNKRLTFLLMSIVIAVTAFSLYYKTIDYDYVFCDDNIFVYNDQDFNKDIGNIWGSFDRMFGTSYYRPVLGMSFVIDANVGKTFFDEKGKPGNLQPQAYHLANIIYHAMGSFLVFAFLVYMRYDIIASFLFALIFTLHPILTPAASWISGRNDSMTTIFILLSFISVIKYYRTEDKTQQFFWLILHLVVFAGSLFTKEISVMFPVLIVFYNLFFKEGIFNKIGNKFIFSAKKFFSNENLILALGWSIVAIIWYLKREGALAQIGNNPDEFGIQPFLENYRQIFAIVGKIFFPVKMLALPTFEFFSVASGIVAIITLIILALKIEGVRKRNIAFGLIWFVLFIGPALFVRIYLVGDFFDYAEHRAYLIMVGIFIVLLELFKGMKINYNKISTVSVFLIIAVIFGIKASFYSDTFDGRKNFWGHKTEMEPQTSRGYLDLGKAYLVGREFDQADSLYQLGIARNPNNINFYIDLSVLELQRKNYKRAEEYGKKSVSLNPNNKMAQYNYANTLFYQSKFTEAIEPFNQAIRRSGGKNWDMLHKMAVCLHNTKQYDKALKYYNAAYGLNKNNYQLLTNYGVVLTLTGQNERGEKLMRDAMKKSPKAEVCYANLFSFYFRTNQTNKVVEISSLAIKNKVKLRKPIELQLKNMGIR